MITTTTLCIVQMLVTKLLCSALTLVSALYRELSLPTPFYPTNQARRGGPESPGRRGRAALLHRARRGRPPGQAAGHAAGGSRLHRRALRGGLPARRRRFRRDGGLPRRAERIGTRPEDVRPRPVRRRDGRPVPSLPRPLGRERLRGDASMHCKALPGRTAHRAQSCCRAIRRAGIWWPG